MRNERLNDFIFTVGLVTLFVLLILTMCYIHDNF